MIRSLWQRFFPQETEKRAYARSLYLAIVQQSRQPFFYKDLGIPDTLQGRFEVLAIHLFLTLHRLRGDMETCRMLVEYFIDDMDRSIREMGAGDTGVGKRVKAMVEAFFGRRQAYSQALGNRSAMIEALRRNAYAKSDSVNDETLAAMAKYIEEMLQALEARTDEQLVTG